MVSSGDPQPLKVSAAAVNSNGPPLPVPRAAQPSRPQIRTRAGAIFRKPAECFIPDGSGTSGCEQSGHWCLPAWSARWRERMERGLSTVYDGPCG